MNLYNLIVRMVFLILMYPILVRDINKMATGGGGGAVNGRHSDDCKRDFGPRLKSPPGYKLFSLIIVWCEFIHSVVFVRIHTNEFIQLLYKMYSTNSYTMWFLYQFMQFVNELYSTNSYKVVFIFFSKSAQAASAQREPRGRRPSCERIALAASAQRKPRGVKPEHTSCPNQAAPGCPDH
jgi:hypothetical protein